MNKKRTTMAYIVVLFALSTSAFANQEERRGISSDNYWSTNANWAGAFSIQANDDLLFPDETCQFNSCNSAFRRTNINDYPLNTNFGRITFTGSNYTIQGNQVFLSGGFSVFDRNINFRPNIVIGASQIWQGSGELELDGVVNLNGRTLSLDVGDLTFDRPIHGTSGSKVTVRSGQTKINGDTEFSNFTTVKGGILLLNGTIDGPLFLDGGRVEGSGIVYANSNNSFNLLDAGTISPGNSIDSIDTLAIIGETQFNREDEPPLEINLDITKSGAVCDLIQAINGNFQIQGADLNVVFSDPPPAGRSFVVLLQSGAGDIFG